MITRRLTVRRLAWAALLLSLGVLMSLRVPWALNLPSHCGDLEERWIGTRELLLNHRDPYSLEVTRAAQVACYGPDPAAVDPHDPKHFVYPIYVALFLAPTVSWQWPSVQWTVVGVLALMSGLSAALWLRAFDLPTRWAVAAVPLMLVSPAVLQGLHLQQLGLLSAALIPAAVVLLQRGNLAAAGVVMAIATIKPPAVFFAACWMLLWSLAEWPRRIRFAAGFIGTVAVLSAAGEWLLPGWIPEFLAAVRAYRNYGGLSLPELFFGRQLGLVLMALSIIWLARKIWRTRHAEAGSDDFLSTLAAAMGISVLVGFALYNFVQLLPSLFCAVNASRRASKEVPKACATASG
jgi:Glycosyltransferase family 87